MNPVRIHEGAGPFTTELLLWYCAMLQWRGMDRLQLLTLYLAPTPTFSSRKAKINLHATPKWTVVIPIICLLPCAVPGIFVMGGGGGSTSIWQKKKNSDSVVCLFFAFFLVLGLFLQKSKWWDRLLACTCARFPATSLYVFSQAPQ